MPTSVEILAGLTDIANSARWLALAWHVALAGGILALLAGWRPSRRLAATLTMLPVASASALAWAYGNPFNGLVLGGAAVALGVLGARLPSDPVRGTSWSRVAAGGAVIAYGWIYPHFLIEQPSWVYLYAAPVGLVPCPSLSIAIGFAIAGGGYGSRRWSMVLGVLGAFYGVVGTLRLGVWLDVGLLAASALLLPVAVRGTRSRSLLFVRSHAPR